MSYYIENNPTPDIDWTCQNIAEYLRDGLNNRYLPAKIAGLKLRQQRHLESVTAGLETASNYFLDQINLLENYNIPAPKAVIGVRSYDTFNVPLDEFPLLKVYRTSDLFAASKTVSMSPVVAVYCLSLPAQEELQGSLRWVSKTINELLLQSQQRFCTITTVDRRAEYRTLVNEMALPLYTFLKFYFTIKD